MSETIVILRFSRSPCVRCVFFVLLTAVVLLCVPATGGLITKGYNGYLYLPAWTGLVMWLAADFSGLIASVDDMGGIAHAAHLGGMILGLLMGFFLLLGRETASQGVLGHAARLNKLQ